MRYNYYIGEAKADDPSTSTIDHFIMRLTNHQTASVTATYVSLSTYDNELDVTDQSGDKLTIKGLTTKQLDGMCCDWIRSRINQDESIKGDYPFSSLIEKLQQTADV